MLKRMILAVLLALPTAGVVNQMIDPLPDCLPCPTKKNAVEQPKIAADAAIQGHQATAA